ALEARNFEAIRMALSDGRFEIVQAPLEGMLAEHPQRCFDAFNLSDIFEYMSNSNTADLLEKIAAAANPGARLAYWNMLAPRSRPEALADRLRPCTAEAEHLLAEDRAFFYSRFVVEEVMA
ncbi:MAG: DUF3419 family protein, partial [Verrucomicrobia bacterium]|nr:DUF3419 family protein [Verrucomicrobiota bacterium]